MGRGKHTKWSGMCVVCRGAPNETLIITTNYHFFSRTVVQKQATQFIILFPHNITIQGSRLTAGNWPLTSKIQSCHCELSQSRLLMKYFFFGIIWNTGMNGDKILTRLDEISNFNQLERLCRNDVKFLNCSSPSFWTSHSAQTSLGSECIKFLTRQRSKSSLWYQNQYVVKSANEAGFETACTYSIKT